MKRPVYMDYAAATPLDPRVVDAMLQCLTVEGSFANPSSKDHIYGWEAAEAVETAREQVANLVGCSPLEITFTSGATESNNLAIIGLARGLRHHGDTRRHIVTSLVEHKAVLEACEYLEKFEGYKVTYLKPHQDGSIDKTLLEPELTDDTFLVSIAHGNSVLGTVNDIQALAALCKEHNVYFHTDCAQTAGWEKTDFDNCDVTLASLTPEKIYGPKGVGALYVKRSAKIPLEALIYGGGQEKGLRGGTVATHQVAAMGKAFELMAKEGSQDKKRMAALREYLVKEIAAIDGAIINGSQDKHLPGIISASFQGIDGHMLLPTLSGIAASTGSACSSAELKPSYVLKAIGLSDDLARASIRLSLGRFSTKEDIEKVALELKSKIATLKAAGSMWTVHKK